MGLVLSTVALVAFLQNESPPSKGSTAPIAAGIEVGPFFSAANIHNPANSDFTVGGNLRIGLPRVRGFASTLRLEVVVHGDFPIAQSATPTVVLQLRAGVEYPTWRVSAGAWLNICPLCAPVERFRSDGPASSVQVLPSLYGRWQSSFIGVAVGIFDEPTGAFGHADLLLSRWAIGYVFPIGARAAYSHPLTRGFSLDGRLYGFWFSGAYQVGFLVGFSWSNGTARPPRR